MALPVFFLFYPWLETVEYAGWHTPPHLSRDKNIFLVIFQKESGHKAISDQYKTLLQKKDSFFFNSKKSPFSTWSLEIKISWAGEMLSRIQLGDSCKSAWNYQFSQQKSKHC